MTQVEAAVLGAVQGLTEFLPISSSAHLYVLPTLLGWRYGGVAFDVALHWGTLAAVLAAFWREWLELVRNAFHRDPHVRSTTHGMWIRLAVASVPTAVAGVLLHGMAAHWLRSLPLQAATLSTFGFLLWWIDRSRPALREEQIPGWGACLFIGAMQSLALIPGVSRSGVTITAGRLAGLTRVSAARFSFLLAAPITLGAGVLELKAIPAGMALEVVLVGMVSAALVGLLAIHGLIHWVGRAGFGAFFAYRTALALFILFHWLRD